MLLTKRHLANTITMSRILGVGLIFWLTPYRSNDILIWTVLIYATICLTDFFDGWVARKLNIVTDLGKVLDPFADKILVLVFLPLLEMQVISSFPVFIILAREFAIMALRIVSAKNGTIVEAKASGKIKTAFTLPVCGILLGRVPVESVPALPAIFGPVEWLRLWVVSWPGWVILTLIWLTVAVTIWSFLDYFKRFIWQQYVQKAGGNEVKARQSVLALVPNGITLTNLLCGITAIGLTFKGVAYFPFAVLLILVGIFLDGIDGRVARALGVYSDLGAKLDSKADYVSFGIAPGFLVFKSLSNSVLPYGFMLGLLLGCVYYGTVHFRLKRFDESGHSAYFQGLPSPVGASMVVFSVLSHYLADPLLFVVIVLLVSYLMISKIPYLHQEVAVRRTYLRLIKMPSLLFFSLGILYVFGVPYVTVLPVFDILFVLGLVYLFSPLSIPTGLS